MNETSLLKLRNLEFKVKSNDLVVCVIYSLLRHIFRFQTSTSPATNIVTVTAVGMTSERLVEHPWLPARETVTGDPTAVHSSLLTEAPTVTAGSNMANVTN